MPEIDHFRANKLLPPFEPRHRLTRQQFAYVHIQHKVVAGPARAAQDSLQVSAEQLRCVVAYLQPEYEEIEKQPTNAELDGLALEVAADIAQMRSLCQDPERKIPLVKEHFPLTDNVGYCRHCAFRELCDRVEDGVAPTGGDTGGAVDTSCAGLDAGRRAS